VSIHIDYSFILLNEIENYYYSIRTNRLYITSYEWELIFRWEMFRVWRINVPAHRALYFWHSSLVYERYPRRFWLEFWNEPKTDYNFGKKNAWLSIPACRMRLCYTVRSEHTRHKDAWNGGQLQETPTDFVSPIIFTPVRGHTYAARALEIARRRRATAISYG